MKIKPYIERLNNSQEYKTFQKEYKDSFMVAGFFILDLESGKNMHQLDYYVPSKKKIAAFTLDNKVTMQMMDMMNSKVPQKLDIKTNIDLDAIQGILEEEMKNRNMTEGIKKIIAIVQNIEGKNIWNLNCVLSGMGILNAHVEDESKTVLKMEKKSLMDYIQKMPAAALKQQMQQPSVVQPNTSNVKDQLKKLDELQKALEQEKSNLLKAEKENSAKKPIKAKSKK